MQKTFLRRVISVLVATVSLSTVVAVAATTPADATSSLIPTLATWTSGSSGSIGGVAITASASLGSSSNAVGCDFTVADDDPPSTTTACITYSVGGTATLTFASPVSNGALYLEGFRSAVNFGTTGYTFTVDGGSGTGTWSVLSGCTGATFTGSHLAVTGWTNGIITYSGPISSILITPDSLDPQGTSSQAFSFATLAAPAPTSSSTSTTIAGDDPVTPSFTG